MSKSNYDQLLSIFSPEGNLYQVEYSYKAVKAAGITAVAIRAKDGVVVVSQRKVPDKLMKPESVTNVFSVDGKIGACIIGRVPDGRLSLNWARDKAFNYKYDCGHPISAQLLAKRRDDVPVVVVGFVGFGGGGSRQIRTAARGSRRGRAPTAHHG